MSPFSFSAGQRGGRTGRARVSLQSTYWCRVQLWRRQSDATAPLRREETAALALRWQSSVRLPRCWLLGCVHRWARRGRSAQRIYRYACTRVPSCTARIRSSCSKGSLACTALTHLATRARAMLLSLVAPRLLRGDPRIGRGGDRLRQRHSAQVRRVHGRQGTTSTSSNTLEPTLPRPKPFPALAVDGHCALHLSPVQ